MDHSSLWLTPKKISSHPASVLLANAADKTLSHAYSVFTDWLSSAAPDAQVICPDSIINDASKCLKLSLSADNASGDIPAGGYKINADPTSVCISGSDTSGLICGIFDYIRRVTLADGFVSFTAECVPSQPLRMLNHWDNADGSIERGYSGRSFFFSDGKLIVNERTEMYARLIASIGINGVVINNVNVRGSAKRLLTADYADSLEKLGELFGRYGIKLFICPDFAAPISVGGLDTADPLDERVVSWWNDVITSLFERVPSFGGFLVKADSEGQPGPFAYGRTHADGANMLARAMKKFGGIVIWRCFVYNCTQDWRDLRTDRARSGYDNFMPLDGEFEDNVILQVKNGPMDFQVREPVHPLFGAMKHTNIMAEFQLAQEYTGQQKHVCWLVPMIKDILDHHTKHDLPDDRVSRTVCGVAAVANTGDDFCWTGSELAAANLYGYGRLLFDETLTVSQIADEWTRLTFGSDEKVVSAVKEILCGSHKAYESYTAPLGIGWMCKPGHHYGPDPWGYEFDRWGTYNRADRDCAGVDRSPSGTGYSTQYAPELAELYGSAATCPDELLLFFHRVPYTHKLHSGKTVIQHIYDSHFEGFEQAEHFAALWDSLKGRVDERTFQNVSARFEEQLRCAKEWRDIVNTFFHRLSGIPDEKGRKIYD